VALIGLSAVAVALETGFYLEKFSVEVTLRLSVGGFLARLSLLMPALTLPIPDSDLSIELWYKGRSATAPTGARVFG